MTSAAHNAARRRDEPLVIGFVNNMPDAALETTERQFKELLASAAGDCPIRIILFALPELPRADEIRAQVARRYEAPGELWLSRLDGLIVTGTEPRAPRLQDEPYWPTLTRLIDWAEDHTISTVWSCLAAHAAVLHTDAITRRPFATKLSGVFECKRAASHALLAGAPSRWFVPHSRYNDLPSEALLAAGYRIVASSPEVGADLFVKQRKSLSIYLQGHPEYDPDALFREYRRDVRRFLAGEREHYPEMPFGYFDDEARAAFAGFRDRATANRSADLLHDIPTVAAERLAFTWREPAVRLYANWLAFLARRRNSLSGQNDRRDSVMAS
jgi:homoserine O-succinyltransferase